MVEANIFTYLNQIQNKKRIVLYDRKIASAWMISMWLSHENSYLDRICDIIKYNSILPDNIIYEYYMSIIPKRKKHLKWTKKRKDNTDIKKKIEELKNEYPNLSTKECRMIISRIK